MALRDNRLKCPGVGRDKDNNQSLTFYFNRPVTDDEMRFLHEVMQRAVGVAPESEPEPALHLVKGGMPFGGQSN